MQGSLKQTLALRDCGEVSSLLQPPNEVRQLAFVEQVLCVFPTTSSAA